MCVPRSIEGSNLETRETSHPTRCLWLIQPTGHYTDHQKPEQWTGTRIAFTGAVTRISGKENSEENSEVKSERSIIASVDLDSNLASSASVVLGDTTYDLTPWQKDDYQKNLPGMIH